MANYRIFLIIAVHNRKTFTKNCLESIFSQSLLDFKVIIVDDGSTDGTLEMIRSYFPEVQIIEGNGGLWWSASMNLAIKNALEQSADYIISLNDDIILENEFIEKTFNLIKKYPNTIIGASAVDINTKEYIYTGAKMIWCLDKTEKIEARIGKNYLNNCKEVDFYIGRGLIIPSQVFSSVGYFDNKHFPQAMADEDFTRRAYRAGFNILVCHSLIVNMYGNENGSTLLRKNKTIKNYYDHLFTIKGGGNLKKLWFNAIINCPNKYFFQYLIIGSLRRIFGYLIEWALEILRIKKEYKAL